MLKSQHIEKINQRTKSDFKIIGVIKVRRSMPNNKKQSKIKPKPRSKVLEKHDRGAIK